FGYFKLSGTAVTPWLKLLMTLRHITLAFTPSVSGRHAPAARITIAAIRDYIVPHMAFYEMEILKYVPESAAAKMALNIQQQITIDAWAITYANDREAPRLGR
ncbi:hypothetical protein L9F63_007435, partial [Diploptera punctata]